MASTGSKGIVNIVRLSRLFFILCVIVLPSAVLAANNNLVIDGIRYGMNASKTRIVIDTSKKTPFRAFALASPNRIVIDVPNAGWKIPRARFVSDEVIKGYRSGALDGGVTRIIFDLRKPAVISQGFALPKDSMAKDRLVIDIAPASQNLFNASLEEVFGDRDLKGAGGIKSADAQSEFRQMQNTLVQDAVPQGQAGTLPLRKPLSKSQLITVPKPDKYTIIIDPGHGGEDPGAIGASNIREKNITLATARELKRQLEESGRYRVYLTRDKDYFVRLRERVNFSRKKHGDLFISIHADKIGRKNVRGASIYTLSETASDAESERLADEENKSGVVSGVDLSEESADVADILLDLAMREKMNESNLLARFLEQALQNEKIRLLPNSHRSAGFAVLKAPDVPAALLEIGFLSNEDEAKLLTSSQFQRQIGGAIMNGIDAYFRKIQALQKI